MTTLRISSYSYDQHARAGNRKQPPAPIYSPESEFVIVSPPKQKRPTSAHSVTSLNGRRSIVPSVDQDFTGVTNVMRKISIHSHRRWKPTLAWSADSTLTGGGQMEARGTGLGSRERVNGGRRKSADAIIPDTDDSQTNNDMCETQSESDLPPRSKAKKCERRSVRSSPPQSPLPASI